MKSLNNLCLRKQNGIFEPIDMGQLPAEINVQNGEPLEMFFLLFNNELNIKVNLLDEEETCTLNAVYLTSGVDKCRIRFDVNHAAPHTQSKQTIKGILTDESRVIFDGVIRMPQDSQHCVGQQNHRALILSDKAQVQATPELEIYADDVQCAHGSAVGPLEKEHLFYLMARGIDEKTAQKMLLESFILDIVPDICQEKVQNWLNTHI